MEIPAHTAHVSTLSRCRRAFNQSLAASVGSPILLKHFVQSLGSRSGRARNIFFKRKNPETIERSGCESTEGNLSPSMQCRLVPIEFRFFSFCLKIKTHRFNNLLSIHVKMNVSPVVRSAFHIVQVNSMKLFRNGLYKQEKADSCLV